MYSKEFRESLNAVEAAREANIALEPARMTAEEKEKLLKQYHPDYKTSEFAVLKVGANSGEEVPHELCEMLQAHSRINPCEIDLEKSITTLMCLLSAAAARERRQRLKLIMRAQTR